MGGRSIRGGGTGLISGGMNKGHHTYPNRAGIGIYPGGILMGWGGGGGYRHVPHVIDKRYALLN